jgi:hypothetical protein
MRTRESEMLRQKECKADGREPFEGVHEENRIAPPLSQNAQNIRCSDVPAPSGADINARDASRKVSRREGSEEVPKTTNGERKKPHGDELLRVGSLRSVVRTGRER